MMEQIDKDALTWRGNAPVSARFDDVYYSEENGLEETNFVFLRGINAPNCWLTKENYVIAETGFGTGLNFLATYQAWVKSGAIGQLIFISSEKYPLNAEALAEAHKTFPELASYSQELSANWPPPERGLHQRLFANGKVQLLLLFGDANETFQDIHATVDAWYLDGFAPAKNPGMWTDQLFDQIARLSKKGTRFATFTAAGFVRRALTKKGFNVEKVPGYGRKRERLIGVMDTAAPSTLDSESNKPSWAAVPRSPVTQSTIIIGAGIAGSSLAHSLHAQGHQVTLVSDGGQAGSDVPAAVLSPGFQRSDQPASVFATTCFTHACSFPPYRSAWAEKRGVRLSSTNPEERKRLKEISKKLAWGKEWLDPTEDGYILPQTGCISPAAALHRLQNGIAIIKGSAQKIEYLNGQWQIQIDTSKLTADNLVIACAMESDLILGSDHQLDLRPKPGQIEVTSAQTTNLPDGNHVYGGYVTAALTAPSQTQYRTIGSTFEVRPEHNQSWPEPTSQNREINLQTLKQNTGSAPSTKDIMMSWAGIRATTPDYMPYIGPVPDWERAAIQFAPLAKDRKLRGMGDMPYKKGLYVLTGFGAKGFQQAPLCAAYIAALICNTPLPIAKSLIPYLHPARHMIKSIVRGSRL